MLPHARLRPGPGFRVVRSGCYYAQRAAVAPILRNAVGRAVASAIGFRHGPGATPAVAAQHEATTAALREEGIAMLPELCSERQARAMLDYFESQPVVVPGGRLTDLDAVAPGTALADYPLRTVLECPGLLRLINHPRALAIASLYLGCKPTLSSLGVRWSFPREGRGTGIQALHRDPDDWRFLKLFIYLTDVGEGCGPHVFVRRSHRTAGRVRSSFYDENEVVKRYGRENVQRVFGPCGTTFIADTYGIHSGDVPRTRPRLILQAQYSLLPVFSFEYAPLAIETGVPVDAYVNRLLMTSRTQAPAKGFRIPATIS